MYQCINICFYVMYALISICTKLTWNYNVSPSVVSYCLHNFCVIFTIIIIIHKDYCALDLCSVYVIHIPVILNVFIEVIPKLDI